MDTSSAKIDFSEVLKLFESLVQPSAWSEWAMLAACLGTSWLFVWYFWRSRRDQNTIWFGRKVVDGLLFPVLSLVLTLGLVVMVAISGGKFHGGVFKLAVPILISFAVIRLTARVLRASFPSSRWLKVVEHTVSWLAWGAVILWVTGLLPLMLEAMEGVRWKMGASRVSLRDALEGLLVSGVVLMVALSVSTAIEQRITQGSGDSLSIRKMAANIIRVILLGVGLVMSLGAVGIDLTALSVLGGAMGVGLGLGLQRIAANYVSGFVILAERSLRIGDMVKVDSFEGKITDIRTRYTVIRALNGRESVVPNETLITQRVENMSLAEASVLVTTTVSVAYGTDVRALLEPMADAVRRVPRVLQEPGPAVQMIEFGADGLLLSISFWIGDPENGVNSVRSAVNLDIMDLLAERGIEIPFPQRVLTVRPQALPLAATGAGEAAVNQAG